MSSYAQADKTAKQIISTKDYITQDLLTVCLGTNWKCGPEFTKMTYDNINVTSNWTADRKDNDESHIYFGFHHYV